MRGRKRVHRVGVLAAAIGGSALLLGDFASLASSRISPGVGRGMFESLPHLAAAPLVLWFAVLLVSLAGRARPFGIALGTCAALVVLAVLWMSGVAARAVIPPADTVARYSIGGGAWLSMLAAVLLLIAVRREVGATTPAGIACTIAVPLGVVVLLHTGALDRLGIVSEYRNVSPEFRDWVLLHAGLVVASVTTAAVIAISLGIAAHRRRSIAGTVFTFTGLAQTVPGLAMIGVLAVPLGIATDRCPGLRQLGIGQIGWAPLFIALTLYALLMIARNTYAGLDAVPADVVDAAAGMGMSRRQILLRVEMPLAVPIVFSGVRTAVQQTVGNAALGVFVSVATLGRPIFGGVSQTADDLTLLGSITLVAVAFGFDIMMRAIERPLAPRGTRGRVR